MNMKNSQYQAIMRQYDRTQLHNRHALDLRFQEISTKLPAYADISRQITGLMAGAARQAVLTGSADGCRQQISVLKAQQKQLLSEAGYPEDYLEPFYQCPDCRDTGYIGDKKCHCFKQAVVELLYDQSNIQTILAEENFDHFNYAYYDTQTDRRLGISPRENIQAVVRSCRQFIHDFDASGKAANLLFYGSTGVGKTFLSHCIAHELLDTSHTVIYLTAFQMADILQNNTFSKDAEDDYDENMYDYILDCDLLILDDLGTELNNRFITSQFFLCINERLLRNKSTIISTNFSLDELQSEYSERIFSRLISNYEILLILGDDIRIKKAIS